jgi:hypothetical protein
VHRLLGKIKIAEQANQSCQDSSRIQAIKGVEQFAYLVNYLLGGTFGHDDNLSKPVSGLANFREVSKWKQFSVTSGRS